MKVHPLYLLLAVVMAGLAYLLLRPAGAPPPSVPGPEVAGGEVYYWTAPPLEPDTFVAAWLLTRFVTPGAAVRIVDSSPGGVAFDVPGCELQRRPGQATSDVVLQVHRIKDPLAVAVTAVVHEIELNPWTTRDDPFFAEVRSGLAEAVNASSVEQECLARALEFLDDLRTRPAPP